MEISEMTQKVDRIFKIRIKYS